MVGNQGTVREIWKALTMDESLGMNALLLLRGTNGRTVLDLTMLPACEYHRHGQAEDCPYNETCENGCEAAD